MKLYTQEQVVNALNRVFIESITIEDVNEVMRSLTPIQLPSDEEIQKENPYVFGSHVFGTRDLLIWEQGAKWMRDKIGGNNEQ